MKISVAEKDWLTEKVWRYQDWDENMFSNPFCWIIVFEVLFLHTIGLKFKKNQTPEQCLLVLVFNSKTFHLVRNNFLLSISIFCINVFHPVPTGGQMFFQIGCFPEDCVTTRETKGLEQCCDVVHVAYLNL